MLRSCTLDPQPCKLHPGLLRRNLRCCPAKFKETAYITLVRSTLEYAASIRDPHLAKDCDLLEKLQRRSARFVKGDYRTTSSVSQLLHDLGWCDLKAAGGILDWLCSVRTVSDWNQLPAVVVEQENPAAFKAQLARSGPVACHNPLPPLACRSADYCARQDKTLV